MKRVLVLLLLTAAFAVPAEAARRLDVFNLSKRYYDLATNSIAIDSSYATTGAGFQIKARTTTSADTLAPIDISRFVWDGGTTGTAIATTTAQPFARLWIVPGIGTMDSLNFDYRVSPDGLVWSPQKGLGTWITSMTAGRAYSFPLTFDADAGLGDLWGARFVQVMLHGRTGNAYNGCRAFITGWTETSLP